MNSTGGEGLPPSDRLLRTIMSSAIDYAIITMDRAGIVTSWSRGAENILGWTAADMVGRSADIFFTPEDCAAKVPLEEMATAVRTGSARDERWHLKKDGTRFWASGELTLLDDGEVGGFLKIIRDRTQERVANLRLEASEARLSLALSSARMAVWEFDGNTGSISITPQLKRLFGYAEDEPITLGDIRARYVPGELERLNSIREHAVANGDLAAEAELACAWGGEKRWFLIRGEFVGPPEEPHRNLIGVVLDITPQKRAEQQLGLVIAELNHRVKNNLAVVQAMASQTLRGNDPTAEIESFGARLASLARTHDLLIRRFWNGARLQDLLDTTAEVHVGGASDRFNSEACDVDLPAEAATFVAMALHELATNALKYGSLSNSTGQVRVICTRDQVGDQPVLTIRWRESGGPPVSPPMRQGFGTRLIEMPSRSEAVGATKLDFHPDGLQCTLQVVIG